MQYRGLEYSATRTCSFSVYHNMKRALMNQRFGSVGIFIWFCYRKHWLYRTFHITCVGNLETFFSYSFQIFEVKVSISLKHIIFVNDTFQLVLRNTIIKADDNFLSNVNKSLHIVYFSNFNLLIFSPISDNHFQLWWSKQKEWNI